MSGLVIPKFLHNQQRSISTTYHLLQRTPFGKPKRNFEEKNRLILKAFENQNLKLATPVYGKPDQYVLPPSPLEPTIVKKDHKLVPLKDAVHDYAQLKGDEIKKYEAFETYYDPLFNPHLHEERYRVDPNEEPFEAIYMDSKSEDSKQYTKTRNITTPELWSHVERLARQKVAPEPRKRKAGEPIEPMPSGFVPPPDTPPDLPYFIPRTRNYLLPVYYFLSEDPDDCRTQVNVQGDLWQFEQDVREHLEKLNGGKRILTSVQEPDEKVAFRGKYIHQIVDYLHAKGF